MPLPNIYALSDHRWNNALTTYNAIWMNVDNGAGGSAVGAAASRLLKFTNNNVDVFAVGLDNTIYMDGWATFQRTGPQFGTLTLNPTGSQIDTFWVQAKLKFTSGWFIFNQTTGFGFSFADSNSGVGTWAGIGSGGESFLLAANLPLGWSNLTHGQDFTNQQASADLTLNRDATDTLALRRGTNLQKLRIYNTFTDSSNYERFSIDWTGGAACTIGTEAAGTGTNRPMYFVGANINFSPGGNTTWQFNGATGDFIAVNDNANNIGAPGANRPRDFFLARTFTPQTGTITTDIKQIDGSVTWNAAGVTFTGWKLDVINTASAIASRVFKFTNNGALLIDLDIAGNLTNTGNSIVTGFVQAGNAYYLVGTGGILPISDGVFRFQNVANSSFAHIATDAPDTLALRRGTNGQQFRVYGTFTDASNYERVVLGWNAGNGDFEAFVEQAGTGTARAFRLTSGDNVYLIPAVGKSVRIQETLDFTFDNAYDIGQSLHRPRNIFQGGYHVVGVLTWGSISASVTPAEGLMIGCSTAVTVAAGVTVNASGTGHALLYYDGTQYKAAS